jgi:hypothetical protein
MRSCIVRGLGWGEAAKVMIHNVKMGWQSIAETARPRHMRPEIREIWDSRS